MVVPVEMNLTRAWPPLPRMDIVFLRNVLIYFDITTKRQIFEGMRRQLKQDGYLLLDTNYCVPLASTMVSNASLKTAAAGIGSRSEKGNAMTPRLEQDDIHQLADRIWESMFGAGMERLERRTCSATTTASLTGCVQLTGAWEGRFGGAMFL